MSDVLGLGNALVDSTINVTEKELKELGIHKGEMQLIEEDRLIELLENFRHRIINRSCGGSSANSIITAQGLGLNCAYACSISNDENGLFFKEELSKFNIKHQLINKEGITGLCIVKITEDAQRSMSTFLGISSQFSKEDLPIDLLKNTKCLYIEGYLAPSPLGFEAACHAKHIADETGIKVALSFSDPSMTKYFQKELKQLMGYNGVHLLFCNEEEACLFTETSTYQDALKILKEQSEITVLTRGKNGLIVSTKEAEHNIKAKEATVIDTNGAGDAVAGAFLASYLNGKSLKEAGELATEVAAQVVSQNGPRLSLDQLKNFVIKK